ncbi:S41 family peptidase [Sphingomonas swuensis]|uniref:S41 family peptidase n=1 Tax=Sphingomonas swuensis TaxID=977800 RepID=A0ABP7T9G4_9SPHN
MKGRIGAAALAFLLASSVASAAPPAERDWSEALARDAQALHDDLAANHPGAVNSLDPGFNANNDRQLKLALERAKSARSYADYFFPLRIYVSSFDDGHLGFGALGNTPNDLRWPGFATRYDGRGRIVVGTSEPESPVPQGAELLSCDGMSASRYAEATLGTMWGRWSLEAQQQRMGAFLFIDESSNLIPKAKECTFAIAGQRKSIPLSWQPLALDRVGPLLNSLQGRRSRDFGERTLPGGIRWLAMPSFDGDPASAAAKALPGMIARARSDRAAMLAAPAIVLDLRGNGGGSSDWSRQLAVALWGEGAEDSLPPGPTVEVDWRASPANLAEIANGYAERRGSEGFSAPVDNWYRSVIAGLGVAVARKQALWRHVDFDASGPSAASSEGKRPTAPALARPVRPIYVLTDSSCASACLDALDRWTALGAIQIGRPTSADTLYMEIRDRTLPSRLTSISVPMKVYRGRKRGSNQPAMPVHRFDGDISDTAALETWVTSLAAARR